MGRVIRMRTYINHPGKCHLARGVGSSVAARNMVMRKSYDPKCKNNFDINNRKKIVVDNKKKSK